VHFLPTDDQRALVAGVRDVLAAHVGIEGAPPPYDEAVWAALTDTGVFTLRTELGLGMASSALVYEELGRTGVAGPLVGTFLAAGLVDGPVTVIDPDDDPLLVTHLAAARAVAVLDADGPMLVDRARVAATELDDPIDPLTPVHEVVEVPRGERFGDDEATTRLVREGAVLTAALQVGIADRVTALAVAYAKQREQFGRTIGSFQAVKHLCADMFVRTEVARAAVHAAAVTLDDPDVADPARAVSGAKLLADEAATANTRSSVQVHGGMGFTWEVPVHFFLKRAWVHATEFGSAERHAEHIAELL
jgi:alkylation response protein AidB-like acyl-CoA dehydrogenase